MNNPNNSETVLITGASSGIGLELARLFAREKSKLILVARNRDALEALAGELRQRYSIEVTVIVADLSDPKSPQFVADELKSKGITVDVLVNNAGFGAMGKFESLSLDGQLAMIQVNASALVALTGLFLPEMIKNNRGGILNVGSLAGFQPGPGMTVYFATKAFVLSFSEGLAHELKHSNVVVSAFCPGSTSTNFGKVARGNKERKHKVSKMSAEKVAAIGHAGFRAGKLIIIPGFLNQLAPYLVRIFPRSLIRKIVGHYNQEVYPNQV